MKKIWILGGAFLSTCLQTRADDFNSFPITMACEQPPMPAEGQVLAYLDMPYSFRDPNQEKVDVYVPAGGGIRPLIVYVHGGGWARGSKNNFRNSAMAFAAMGYAVASVEYRLTFPGYNRFPAAVEDVRCAVRWLKHNALELGIDKTRVASLGTSAGGHLVAMLGTAAHVGGLDDEACGIVDEEPTVNSVVAFYGPLDLRESWDLTMVQRLILQNFLGTDPENIPEIAALASPITHISNETPPFLLVHGAQDGLVPAESSRRMHAALVQAQRPSTYIELPGFGHGFEVLSPRPELQASMCTTIDFIRETLGL